jgi:hypothetical protein
MLYSKVTLAIQQDIADRLILEQSELDKWLNTTRQGIAEHGVKYLTVVLPSVGKRLDRSLQGDTWFEYDECIPASLYSRVFSHNGYLRHDVASNHEVIETVKALRQFLYAMYKLELPYELIDELKVIYGFIETDRSLPEVNFREDPVVRKARSFTTKLFASFSPREIKPGHGPGAVSTGETQSEKGEFKRIYRSLERYYPFSEYFVYSPTHIADCLDWIQTREVLDHGTAKVVLVPKDSRGPRLISCEPLELQWIQQGLARKMMAYLEGHPLTAGFVNFTDQSVNQWLALLGSTSHEEGPSRNWVTLDMKDASDRVSLSLVECLFSGTEMYQALLACRSAATLLPSGEVLGLKKFAPMGSACCFPVEALCFYVLALAVLSAHYAIPMQQCVGRVYVYGDDIICKGEDYALLLQYFPKVGLKFNSDKCCIRGLFRESCGVDAFNGINVTPVKFRTVWSHRKTVQSYISYVEYSNALYKIGYHRTCSVIRKHVNAKYGKTPYTQSESSGFVSYYTDMMCKELNKKLGFRYRYNLNLQRLEILALQPHTKSVRSKCHSDWAEMLRSTLYPTGSGHGLHPVRRRVNLRRRWSLAV